MRTKTKCLHSGYSPKNSEPRVMPIVQSTTYVYDSTKDVAEVFDDPTKSLIYSRFANPTVMAVEEKISQLEGGIGAICTSSGQAANLLAILNICQNGENFLASDKIYGGSINLFTHTLKKFGIECRFFDPNSSKDEITKLIDTKTKAIFGETIANPSLDIFDIPKFASLAHENGIPLIIDNTFATPILCKAFKFGADIITHSTSKYMDGHAVQVGGVIVDSGNFDWRNSKFREFREPDQSYHGIIYSKKYGKMAYLLKLRMQLMRDFGSYPAAHSAFLLNLGLETLAIRMKEYCKNALKIAKFLEKHEKIKAVNYPFLKSSKDYKLAKNLLKGGSGVISFELIGDKNDAIKFMDFLKLASNEVHVADIRTCVLHPASSTHRQLSDEQLKACGISGTLIRLSVGLEDVKDIRADLMQALNQI